MRMGLNQTNRGFTEGEKGMKRIGFCPECSHVIYSINEIEWHEDSYECPRCKHPSAKGELWAEPPIYV